MPRPLVISHNSELIESVIAFKIFWQTIPLLKYYKSFFISYLREWSIISGEGILYLNLIKIYFTNSTDWWTKIEVN